MELWKEWLGRLEAFLPVRTQLSDLGNVTSGQIISKLSTIVLWECSRPCPLEVSTDTREEVTQCISLAAMM